MGPISVSQQLTSHRDSFPKDHRSNTTMCHKSQELSIWNQLFYGKCRVPAPIDLDQALWDIEEISDHGDQNVKEERSPIELIDEKHSMCVKMESCESCDVYRYHSKLEQESKAPLLTYAESRSLGMKFFDVFTKVLIFCGFILFWSRPQSWFLVQVLNSPARHRILSYVDTGSYAATNEEVREIISVAYPYIPKKSYGKPVHTEVLVDYVFDSWGNPSLTSFKPPKNITFNKVVLTLNTSVSGVQYDRLAHLYVGGAEIWRTSTMEPGGRKVHSSFKKDVSQYQSLFQQETPVLFQLDNLVLDGLDGKFHVKLQADFYSSVYFHETGEGHVDLENQLSDDSKEKYMFFDINKDADHVYPLNTQSDLKKGPIEYLPSLKFKVTLPQVAQNTTRLKLAVFASGNGNEEFWYSNVLDKFKRHFEDDGTAFFGHGPLRFVSVKVDGQKVASQAPQPFIFTGGFSPALWSPVVGLNAFDLSSIDLDVTPLLPLLWKSGNHELEIQVDNGIDDFEGSTSGIGNDWIISANLLAYENSNVKSSSGRFLGVQEESDGRSTGVSIPYTKSLQQFITGKYKVEMSGDLVLELHNDRILNTTVKCSTYASSTNAQSYSDGGKVGHIAHEGLSVKKFQLRDNLSPNEEDAIFHSTEVASDFPLALTYKEKMVKNGFVANHDIALSKKVSLHIGGKPIRSESNSQKGSSHWFVGDHESKGSAKLVTKYNTKVDGPTKHFTYARSVVAKNGKIVSDKVTEENDSL